MRRLADSLARLSLLLSLSLAAASCRAVAPTPAPEVPAAVEAIAVEAVDDGPYAERRADGRVVARWVRAGEVVERTFAAGERLPLDPARDESGPAVEIPAAPPEPDPCIDAGVDRFLAVSDLHGDHDSLVALLRAGGVVDDTLRWSFENGRLVVVGDVFDRGAGVTECLWLLYRLEQEARRAGGGVHFLLGNHEVMILQGDERYLAEKYGRVSEILDTPHVDLYGPNTLLGEWLRARNVVLRLDDRLFVHGGLHVSVVERRLDLPAINEGVRASLDVDASSTEPGPDETGRFLLGRYGPLWYRGWIREHASYPAASTEEIRGVLARYGASSAVVGHTEVPEIRALHGGLVVPVDVPLGEGGRPQALLGEDSALFRVEIDGGRTPIPGT